MSDLKRPQGVRVDTASKAERRLIEGLAQFYIYDFSVMEPPGSTDFAFEADGG